MTVHVTQWDEHQVLDYFWMMARNPDVDKIALLRQLETVQLARPRDWDMEQVRVEMAGMRTWGPQSETARLTVFANHCWSCLTKERRLYWHHVIRVAHGGSSTPRNVVRICHQCHGSIHSHLPPPTTAERRSGFVRIGDVIQQVAIKFAQDEKVNQ